MKKIIFSIFILLSFFVVTNVYAADYRVNELRSCIVKKCSYQANKELDYNGDKKIDVLDLIETRNTEGVIYEEVKKQSGPGFGKITGVASQEIGKSTSKTKKTVTTTRKKATTKKKNTTTKRATVKNTTTKKGVTTKATTTKATTTRATTSVAMYNVSVTANNASADESVKQVKKGAKATFKFSPEAGYTQSTVSCTNGAKGSYSKDTNTLNVSYISADSSCNVVFAKATLPVVVKASYGTVSESKVMVEVGGSRSTTVKPNAGYTFESATCTAGANATWANDTLTISNVTQSSTCTVKFAVQKYTVTIKDNAGTTYYSDQKNYSSAKVLFSIKTDKSLNKSVSCNGKTYTASLTKSGGVYIYKVSIPIVENTTCTYTVN